jgi:hypothetical protein
MCQQDRQCMYKRNIEVRSRSQFCRRKDISTASSECMSVYLVTQHAKRMWPFRLYRISPHYLINDTIFEKKFPNIKSLFLNFSTAFV